MLIFNNNEVKNNFLSSAQMSDVHRGFIESSCVACEVSQPVLLIKFQHRVICTVSHKQFSACSLWSSSCPVSEAALSVQPPSWQESISSFANVLQLRPFRAQWMWEDHVTEVHRGNSENRSGPHHRTGEAACVSRAWSSRKDGRIHATGTVLHN